MARLTREESKARTRDLLIAAGWRVFVRDGFHRATLAGIADEAGFTTGAVYSAFESKADLFLAVLDRWMESRLEEVAALADLPDAGRAQQAALQWFDRLRKEPGWQIVLLEFRLHAARERKLNAAYRVRNRRFLDCASDVITTLRVRSGLPPSPLADELAVAVAALGYGFSIERLTDPSRITDEQFAAASARLVQGFIADEPRVSQHEPAEAPRVRR
jgi:AcrR family transcriptional regulator